jgi:hypothetical protein
VVGLDGEIQNYLVTVGGIVVGIKILIVVFHGQEHPGIGMIVQVHLL